MCSSPHSICKFLFKYMYILKMFQSTTFMWIWKQYFSECLWPCTCLHLNHCYRHSWKFSKKSKEHTPLRAVQHLHILLRIRSGSCSPGPRWAQGTWPWLFFSLTLFLPLFTVFQPDRPPCCLLTMQKSCSHLCSHVHMFTCVHTCGTYAWMLLPPWSYVILPSTQVWSLQGSLTTQSILALGTMTLCSSIHFIFQNTQAHIGHLFIACLSL